MFCWSSLAINSLKQHLSYLGFRRSSTSGRASEALRMSKASKSQCCWLMPSALFFLGVWQEAGRFRRFTKTRRCSKKKTNRHQPAWSDLVHQTWPWHKITRRWKPLGTGRGRYCCGRSSSIPESCFAISKTTCTKTRSRNGADTKFHPGCRFFDNLASRV